MHVFAEPVCVGRHIPAGRGSRIERQWRAARVTGGLQNPSKGAASAMKGLNMIDQIETIETELNLEDLEQVQGGLTCRKAGSEQQEYATSGGQSIIVVV